MDLLVALRSPHKTAEVAWVGCATPQRVRWGVVALGHTTVPALQRRIALSGVINLRFGTAEADVALGAFGKLIAMFLSSCSRLSCLRVPRGDKAAGS